MSCFETLPNLTRNDKKILNRVRICLQITSLADMVTGDGKYIREPIRNARRQNDRKSSLDWGIEKPTRAHLRLWKKSIADLVVSENGRIDIELGDWINKPSWTEEWRWMPTSDILAKSVSGRWNIYKPIRSNSGIRTNKYAYSENVPTISEDSYKASVTCVGIDVVKYEGSKKIISYLTPSKRIQKVHETALHYWFNLTSKCLFPLPIILDALMDNNCFFATDGSYMPNLDETRCSGSWLLMHLNGKKLLVGTSFLHYSSANAYVGELLGLLGSLLSLRYLLVRYKRNIQHTIQIHSDCLGAIKWLTSPRRRIKNSTEHSGLIRGLTKELKDSSVKISATHISAHQNDLREWTDLTLVEKANCLCDELAKATLKEAITAKATPPALPILSWNIKIHGKLIYNEIGKSIRKSLAEEDLIPYMEKMGLSNSLFHRIDWGLLGETLHTFPEIFQLWYSKHISNFCGIGSQMKYMNKWPSDLCQCCGDKSERDTYHMMLCQNNELTLTRRVLLKNLFAKMRSIKTNPITIRLYEHVLLGINVEIPRSDLSIFSALHDLQNIGAKHLLNGIVPYSVLSLQRNFFANSTSSYRKWGKDFISMLLVFTHRIWKVRCNIVHDQNSNEVYTDEEDIFHALINELLSTDLSSVPSSKHFVFAYTAREIRKQNMAWIKAWILTALNCIDTEASRDKARDISKARPIRLNMKRKAITKEICTRRDRKRMKSLKYRLTKLNLNKF